jgi:hypothetical protein
MLGYRDMLAPKQAIGRAETHVTGFPALRA